MVSQFFSLAAMTADFTPQGMQAMCKLYEAVGPEMPKQLKSIPIASPIQGAEVLTYNLDEGHAGRVSVPNTPGGSINFQWLISRPDMHKLITTKLSYRDVDQSTTKTTYTGDEIMTFFVPGLNTLHQSVDGETSTMQRLVYYAKVLQTVPLAQIHIGTSFDQGDINIDVSNTPHLRELVNKFGGQMASARPRFDGNTLVWSGRQIDNIQVALSQRNTIDTPVKRNIRQLLDTTKEKHGKPFVLVVYSRGAIECEAALRKHISDSCSSEKLSAVQARLRERVTIVTVGSGSHNYPDGPAYIHLSAWTDPLTRVHGVSAENNVQGAGKDAVFLNCPSPYHRDAFDNHNFGAITAQFLSLVLTASKATDLRNLWEKAQTGQMVVPDDTDRLVRAMIQLTRGYKWLWNTRKAWKGIAFGALPSDSESESLLRKRIGSVFVDRVKRNFH